MNIKVKEAADETLPEADGYLVQAAFKNNFRDFQLNKCFYAASPEAIVDVLREHGGSHLMLRHGLEGIRAKDAKALEAKIKAALKDTSYTGTVEKVNTFYFEYAVVVQGPYDAKVWALSSGNTIPAAQHVYVREDGSLSVGRKAVSDIKVELQNLLRGVEGLGNKWEIC